MIARFEKILLLLATLLSGGTGILYAWTRYLVRPTDPYSVVNHPWQPLFQHAHVLAAPLLVFAVAMIARTHMLGRYRDPRARRGRRMGILSSLLIVPMGVSGYLVQVLTDSGARTVVGWFHLGAGLLFLVATAIHFVAGANGRTDRNARPAAAGPVESAGASFDGRAQSELDPGRK